MFLLCVTGCLIIWILRRIVHSFKISNFTDKHVFITGCDSGFGRDLTIRLDGLGFHVVAGCLTKRGCDDLMQLCSSRAKTCLLDITCDDSIQQALHYVKESLPHGKGLWAVVNNAGVAGVQAPLEMLTKEDYVNTFNVNLFGGIEVTKAFLPLVRKEKGRLVNMTSVMGRFAGVNAPYCASKFAFEGYLDVLRRSVQSQGIKVAILEPGFFPTNMVLEVVGKVSKSAERAFEHSSDEVKDTYGHNILQKTQNILKHIHERLPSSTSWVIDAYCHAITARYPHIRYVVGWDAVLQSVPLTYLPDRLTDWLVAIQMKKMVQD